MDFDDDWATLKGPPRPVPPPAPGDILGVVYLCRGGALVSPPLPLEHREGTPLKFALEWSPSTDVEIDGTRLFCWGYEISSQPVALTRLRAGDSMTMTYAAEGLRTAFMIASKGRKKMPTVFDHVPERP